MKTASAMAFVLTVVGCVAIGAWLVINGHPWFGLLAMLIGSGVSIKDSDKSKAE